MSPWISTILLLLVSNVFMTLAWYGHLKLQSAGISATWPLWVVVLVSWGVALVEYSFQVPANRIGFSGNGGPYSLVQLKVVQECITLLIFVVFGLLAFRDFHIGWNHVAAFILLIGAVYLVFME